MLIEWRNRAERAKGSQGPDRLKGRYTDRRHPLLHAVVTARPNHLPPFDLRGVDLAAAAPPPKKPERPKGFFLNGKAVDPESAPKK